ncbi:MAG: NAD(P)H-dependent glycerol-3-phosphate dehydrogenase [Flavobacteriales bacterium]
MNISVIGGGSWGTALVKLVSANATHVHWWIHNNDSVEHVKKYGHNPRYIQSLELDMQKVKPTASLKDAINSSEIIVIATPAAFLAEVFSKAGITDLSTKKIFCAIKGMVPEYHTIPAHYFEQQLNVPHEQMGIICGPCHAEEVALERLSYLTVASTNVSLANQVAEHLRCRYIKTIVSDDLYGAELAAVLKNIYALGAGIAGGLGYGDNYMSVYISNCLREMEKFVDAVHPIHRDVKSSAYLGDLLVTAYSKFSRNRTFGYMIGQGYSVKAAQLEMQMVAEGYYAVNSVIEMNKRYNVNIPIVEGIYRILYERISATVEMRVISDLLT